MKTIFDTHTRNEIIGRINRLNETSKPQWGKMNVYQMVKHCRLAEELYLGRSFYKRVFLGKLIGPMALRNMLKNDAPMGRNAKTLSAFVVTDNSGDMNTERNKWIDCLKEYEDFSGPGIVHWFFGKMTKEQIGQFTYKHADHHLRQFGV